MTFDYTLVSIDVAKYTKLMDNSLSEDLDKGGSNWLDAVVMAIPIWSGASHGTLLKLANKIGMTVSTSGHSSMPGMLGPAAGASASYATRIDNKGLHTLEYGTSLWHLVYNEYNNANANPSAGRLFAQLKQPGPYGFQGQGGAAFAAFAQGVRLPSPLLALKLKNQKV